MIYHYGDNYSELSDDIIQRFLEEDADYEIWLNEMEEYESYDCLQRQD